MCCRFYSDESTQKDIVSLVDGYDKGIDWLREGDVHPGDMATVIVKGSNGLFAGDMRFGMNASQKTPALLINAKAETVREKKSFAESVASRRCVICAKKFYEWDRDKNKAEFSSVGERSVYLAGIYNSEPECAQAADAQTGSGSEGSGFSDSTEISRSEIQSGRFVILTTEANDSMKPVHDRMPLTLRRDQVAAWVSDDEKTDEILKQVPEDLSVYREYEQMSLF